MRIPRAAGFFCAPGARLGGLAQALGESGKRGAVAAARSGKGHGIPGDGEDAPIAGEARGIGPGARRPSLRRNTGIPIN